MASKFPNPNSNLIVISITKPKSNINAIPIPFINDVEFDILAYPRYIYLFNNITRSRVIRSKSSGLQSFNGTKNDEVSPPVIASYVAATSLPLSLVVVIGVSVVEETAGPGADHVDELPFDGDESIVADSISLARFAFAASNL